MATTKYRLRDLQIHATPKAEPFFKIQGLADVEFDFPGVVRTILLISGGTVRASLHGGQDYLELIGRLYASANPQATNEKHVGKLYVHVHDHPRASRFETAVERLEWHPNGSFDVITADGKLHRVTRPAGAD